MRLAASMLRFCHGVGNSLTVNIASHPRRLESSSAPQWEPQICHCWFYNYRYGNSENIDIILVNIWIVQIQGVPYKNATQYCKSLILFLFHQRYQECDIQCVSTADAENFFTSLKTSIHSFSQCVLQLFEVCWSVSAAACSVLCLRSSRILGLLL